MSSSSEYDADSLLKNAKLVPWDFVVIAAYFVAIIGVGIWSSCRNRGSTKGYFLAGRSMHWIPVGASLFASNIGSGHFVGLAGSGASAGIGVAIFELSAAFVLLLLGWVFVPVYIASGVFTMPEYMRKRFGGQRIRVYLSSLSLILYIFTKISADLYSGAIFLEKAIGWGVYESTVALLFLALILTVAGGLSAVIWTDFAQTCIIIIGAAVLAVLSFVELGKVVDVNEFGSLFEALTHQFFTSLSPEAVSSNTTCGLVPDYAMHFMRPATLTNDLPWTGVVFGITISGVWYWCTDQVIVQRTLAAKNLSYARAGTILAGFLKFTPLWLLIIPGMVSRILFPSVVGCASEEECLKVCGTATGCTNLAYPLLVLKLMPDGLRGLMIAVMLSALMSSLTSIFNSGSTLFTMDIYTRIRKNASEGELLVVARLTVLVLVGVSIAWIPIVKGFSELFHYIQQVTSFLTPPLAAVYVLAISSKRINEQGAFWSLMCGLVVGAVRFIVEFSYGTPPGCGSDKEYKLPAIISQVHYLHFGCLLFGLTAIIAIVISLLTKPINPRKLVRLTYLSRNEPGDRLDQSVDDDLPDHLMELETKNNGSGSVESVDDMGVASTDNLADGNTKNESDVADADKALPWYRIAANWICGIEKQTGPELTDAEQAELLAKSLSIEEGRKWRLVNAVSAIILILLSTFLWAFFA